MYQDFEMPWLLTIWWVFIIVVLWSIVWKGLALWKSARLGHKRWFIVLLVVNTIGILEILYLFIFSKNKEKEVFKKEETFN